MCQQVCFDVCNDAALSVVKFVRLMNFEKAIAEKIANKRKALDDNNLLEVDKLHYQNDIKNLQIIHDKANADKILYLKDRLRVVYCLSFVVVAMVFCFFPPTTLLGAKMIGSIAVPFLFKMIGASTALLFGSIATGLIPRLWTWIGNKVCDTFGLEKSNVAKYKKNLHFLFCLSLVISGVVLTALSGVLPITLMPGIMLPHSWRWPFGCRYRSDLPKTWPPIWKNS